MNHIYRSVWSAHAQGFIAVSEIAGGAAKRSGAGASCRAGATLPAVLKALAGALLLAFGPGASALPSGAALAAGSATVATSGNTMTITQSSPRAALNWQSFNIAPGQSVRFVQPDSAAVALNRVLGAEPSSILGQLSANGKVFLVNPNGILFGRGAAVNVGALVASTLTIGDADFMAGRYRFSGADAGLVLNQGMLNAADGGYVALLGAKVSNQGVIAARLGTVALAAGSTVTLDVAGDGLLNLAVERGALNALVQNGGVVQADGGQVLLTAQAAGALLQTVVNNSGLLQARTIERRQGSIRLLGDMQSGTVALGGTLDASAASGDGGSVETSAARVQVQPGARVSTAAARGRTGSWLIDPDGFTIAASGGNMSGADLSASLAVSNVRIASTAGDIDVSDSVSWSANQLTLNARRDININSALHGSGTASLALEYGQRAVAADNTDTYRVRAAVDLPSGDNFSTRLGSDGVVVNYTVINALGAAGSVSGADLQGMQGNLTAHYALGSNIDASATANWNGGAGFAPVGDEGSPFSGRFDGLGHVIGKLAISRPGQDYVGLFGYTSGPVTAIRNVGLSEASISGQNNVGTLAGHHGGSVENSYASGTVSGTDTVGGLLGVTQGAISNSHADVTVDGEGSVGGLVGVSIGGIDHSFATGNISAGDGLAGGLAGVSLGAISASHASGDVTAGSAGAGGLVGVSVGAISHSHASGKVSGGEYSGGLSGANLGIISDSDASGQVSGGAYSGGLTGLNINGISGSHASGAVSGAEYSGGLTGYNIGAIGDSYATGAVSGGNSSGGLAGFNVGAVSNSYASGAVSGADKVGGLFGSNVATVSNSYASGKASGVNDVGGLIGYNNGAISNSYATGAAEGTDRVGGLAGFNSGNITTSYAIGKVSASASAGAAAGLTAENHGIITDSYWNTESTGQAANPGGGTGLSNMQMRDPASFAGFDFSSTPGAGGNHWVMLDLQGRLMDNASSSGGATLPMLASEYATGIVNLHQLQLMALDTTASYTLARDIDASASAGGIWTRGGFIPVGSSGHEFTGSLDGAGHAIDRLHINLPDNAYVGLFGYTGAAATLRDVGLLDASVTGANFTGTLAGYNNGSISGSYATGAVHGGLVTGGLVGYNLGTLADSYADASVSGTISTGGLLGANYGTVSNSHYNIDTVRINGASMVSEGGIYDAQYRDWALHGTLAIADYFRLDSAGYYRIDSLHGLQDLLGFADSGGARFRLSSNLDLSALPGWYIPHFGAAELNGDGHVLSHLNLDQAQNSSLGLIGTLAAGSSLTNLGLSAARVSGAGMVGALVGSNNGTIANSYATGSVHGLTVSGGLAGLNAGSIANSYASVAVNGGEGAGGLAGSNTGSIVNSYADGAVSGASAGGLAGSNTGTVTASFWNRDSTGMLSGNYDGDASGMTGLSTAGMMTRASYPAQGDAAWDFGHTWVMYEGHTGPLLRAFLRPLTVSVNDAAKRYDGLAYSGGNGVRYSSEAEASLLGSVSYGGDAQGARNAGTYRIGAAGLYSNQQGYLIDYTDGALTVAKAPLTITADNAGRLFGQPNPALGLHYSGFVNGETEAVLTARASLTSTATAASDAGDYAITAAGADAANYSISYVAGSMTVRRSLPYDSAVTVAAATTHAPAPHKRPADTPAAQGFAPPPGSLAGLNLSVTGSGLLLPPAAGADD